MPYAQQRMHFVNTHSAYENSEHYTTVQSYIKKRFSRNWHPAAFASFSMQGCTGLQIIQKIYNFVADDFVIIFFTKIHLVTIFE